MTGEGIEALRSAIAARLSRQAVSLAGEILALQPRHLAALSAAQQSIEQALEMIASQPDPRGLADVELLAATIRAALTAVGELGGDMTPDDVIGKVFATFCIGK